MKKERNHALLAITSSALLLPVYQAAKADAPPDKTELGVRYSEYEEDATQGKKTFGGQTDRYDIDISQFHLLTPLGESWSMGVDAQYDSMSGASPWYTGYAANGEPKIVMSGASIEDDRSDVSVVARHYYPEGNTGIALVRSDEDDYESTGIIVDAAVNSQDQLTTYSASVSYSDDSVEPTQGEIPVDITKESKNSYSAYGGVSQIINKNMIVLAGVGYTRLDGYLSDPYKLNDLRPNQRNQWTLNGSYRYFVESAAAALHLDYRFYDDDWGINSHTLTLAWYQDIGSMVQVIPTLRYYTQNQAGFWEVVADETDQHYADDYRLSSYGAFSYGLTVQTTIDDWTLSVAGERYQSDESWGLYGGDEAPALVQFTRWTVGLDYEF